VQQCAERELPGEGITAPRPSLLKQARRKTYQKSGRLRDWRTRPDPFAGHWEQVTAWLLATPERTAVDIFVELERLYPGRWQPSQKRTLQRGVQKIRRRLLVTFDDHWGEDTATGNTPAPILRAEVMARDS
jgi:hypothetical protein